MSKSDLKRREQEVVDFLREKAAERQQKNEAAKAHKTTLTLAEETLFLENFEKSLKEVFKNKLPSVKPPKHKPGKTKRVLNLVFSDPHYGTDSKAEEVGSNYGPIEEARRTAFICKQVGDYKPEYRDETELRFHILGDLMDGLLHDPRSGDMKANQVARAVRMLTQAMIFFSTTFPKVTVTCVTGNHGRDKSRHQQRAIKEKVDSIETHVYLTLKEVAKFLPNVTVEIPFSSDYTWDSFGSIGYATHGDTFLNFGYPGRSVNVDNIAKQIDRMNNARIMHGKKPIQLAMIGHVHVGTMIHLPGGTVALTNGCLIPPDTYAKSIGIHSTKCGQWMFESVPGHIVGDSRFIEVNEDVDKDETLDKIIEPFTGL